MANVTKLTKLPLFLSDSSSFTFSAVSLTRIQFVKGMYLLQHLYGLPAGVPLVDTGPSVCFSMHLHVPMQSFPKALIEKKESRLFYLVSVWQTCLHAINVSEIFIKYSIHI